MVLHRFRKRTENHARLSQLGLERGGHGDAVKHCVHRDSREQFLLMQRNTQLGVCVQDFRIHFIQALELFLLLGRRVIGKRLIIDRRILHVGPRRFSLFLLQRGPVPIGLQPPFHHELRLALLQGNSADNVFIQSGRKPVFVDGGDKSPFVFLLCEVVNLIDCATHLTPSATLAAGLMDATNSWSCLRSWCAISWFRSDKVTCSSASRRASPIICELLIMAHERSMLHSPLTTLHSVKPMGPSRARMISATVIERASRARLYPPFTPRCELRSRCSESGRNSLPTVGRGSFVSLASLRAVCGVSSGLRATCAISTMPYSVN